MNTDRLRPGLPPRDAARLRDSINVLDTLENPWAVPAMESSRGAEGYLVEMDPTDIAVELATPVPVPTTITTSQNNWLPPDLWTIITASGTPSITGIPKPPPNTYQLLTITNAPGSSTPLLIPHDSSSSSTGNRIKTPDGTTYPVRPGDTIRLLYDPVTEYWWIIADPPPVKFSDSTTFDGNLVLNGSTTIGSGGTLTTHGSSTATFNGPVTFAGGLTVNNGTLAYIKGLTILRSTTNGGPGQLYGDTETAGSTDPTAEFAPPATNDAAPVGAPTKTGLIVTRDASNDGYATFWFAAGQTSLTHWKQVETIDQTVQRHRQGSDATASNTSMVNLAIGPTVTAGRTYIGRAVIRCDNSTAAEGIKFDFDGGSATITSFWASANATAGTAVAGTVFSTALATDINFTSITGKCTIEFNLSLVVNAGGTIRMRFAEDTTATGTATVYADSFLILWEVT